MTTQNAPIIISPVNIESRKNLDIRAGDTVRVYQKIKEKDKTRLQVFEGLVLARKHGSEAGATFTVRKVASGVGVERIFPLYSPMIDKIEIMRRSKVRRSKLYFIREKVSREIKRQMRKMKLMGHSTDSTSSPQATDAEEETPETSETTETKEVVVEENPSVNSGQEKEENPSTNSVQGKKEE
ncbi:50S ribosomal protein L19 [Candidatus Wolfebacteria bacterium]|nr:MAG: 50S ribosomal protein L19 [Candidatus Wolfebacteria bacterium]